MPSLYANIVSANATIPANNNTSLYNATGNVIPVNGNINANNVNVSNSVYVGGQISSVGNITTDGYFIGDGSQLTNVISSYGNANVAAFLPTYTGNLAGGNLALTGQALVTGNIITGGFYFGDGSQLTGITTDYSNANVAAFLPIYSGNIGAGNIAVVNSITGANITASGQISATGDISTQGNLRTLGAQGNIVGADYISSNFFVGDGSLLTNVVATSNYSNANVTSLLAAFGSNTISTTGNISGGYFLGNGSQLTGLPATYSNANVATFLANFGSNTISTTGNVTVGYIVGNGSLLTSLTGANVTGTVANASFATTAGSATTATDAAQANYANIANSVSGANVTGSVAQANVANTANSVAGANVSGQVANALVAGTVYTAAQPNITSVGTLTVVNTTGNVSATGNITGGNLAIGNNASVGGNLSVVGTIFGTFAGNISGNLVVPGSNTDVIFNNSGNAGASTNFRFDSANNTMTVNGTANVGSLNSTGNVSGANIVASANAVVGGINTDNYRYANGVPVSFSGTYGNANVADFLDSFGSNAIVTTGNITGGNFIGNGQSLTNLTGANVVGAVANATFATTAATANTANSVAGANVTGTVANATQADTANVANSVAGGNVTGQVANALVAGTVYVNAQPNITSVGTLTSLSVSGNVVGGNLNTAGNVSGSYILGDGSQLTNLPVQPGTYGNSNVATFLAAFGSNTISTTGNVTTGKLTVTSAGNTWSINGDTLTTPDGGTWTSNTVSHDEYINSSNGGYINIAALHANGVIASSLHLEQTVGQIEVDQNLWSFENGNITLPGNTSAINYANGTSILSGLASTYGNSNVATLLANFGSNTISTLGNISAGNINTANYVAFGTTGAQTTAATGQMFWDVTEQTVSLGMNNGVTQQIGLENYILVKASATITNGQVVMFTGASGDNVQAAPADVTSVGFRPGYVLGVATQNIANNAFGYITAFGKVRALNTNAFNVGDLLWLSVSTPGALTATQPTAPDYQIQVATVTKKSGGDGQIQIIVRPEPKLEDISDVTVTSPTAGQALIFSAGNVWVNGNPASANTAVTVTGNAQANITSVGTLTSLSVTGNVTSGNILTSGVVSATGNVTGNFFVGNGSALTGITTSAGGSNTQLQFNNGGAFAGNAAMTFDTTTGNVTLGNIRINANTITNLNSFQSNTNPNPGRILFGNGIAGNYNPTVNTASSRILQVDEILKYDDGIRTAGITATMYGNLSQGNIGTANGNSRLQAAQSELYVVSGNSVSTNAFVNRGYNAALNVGSAANVGNAFVAAGAAASNFITVFAGSSANTMITVLNGATFNGTVANAVSYMATMGGTANVSTTAIGFYMPGTTTLYGGQSMGNNVRGASNYFFVRNDDTLAKSRLGSLEQYQYFTGNASTSGAVTINKTLAQYQNMYLSGNVTSMAFTGFVTRVQTPSGTFVNQSDVVTLVIQQGATPWTVTMPTGNAQIRYANGNSTVPSVANSTVVMTVTGTYNYNTSADNYLINIDPVYT
jgi:hypothetical protein